MKLRAARRSSPPDYKAHSPPLTLVLAYPQHGRPKRCTPSTRPQRHFHRYFAAEEIVRSFHILVSTALTHFAFCRPNRLIVDEATSDDNSGMF